jgi:hypothetical protein
MLSRGVHKTQAIMKVISTNFSISAGQTGNPKSFTMGPWSRGKRHWVSQKGHGPAVKHLGFPLWPSEMETFAEMTFINRGSKSVSWWEHF